MDDPNAVWFEFSGGKDVMPIAGYWGPDIVKNGEDAQSAPEYNSEEFWKAIAESGINLVSYSNMDYARYPKEVIKSLEYAEKYGVSVVVNDQSILDMGTSITANAVEERISQYRDYASFAGCIWSMNKAPVILLKQKMRRRC